MTTVADAGAFFGVSGIRESAYVMQAGDALTQASVLEAFHAYEHSRYVNRVGTNTYRTTVHAPIMEER